MVPDYYARLGVDPGAERTEIEAALQRKQPAWSMGTRNPEEPACQSALSRRDPRVAQGTPERSNLPRRVRRRAGRRPSMPERERSSTSCNVGSASVRPREGWAASDRGLLGDEAARLGLSEEDLLKVTRPIPNLVETSSAERRRRAGCRPARRCPRPVHPPADPRGTRASGLPRPV